MAEEFDIDVARMDTAGRLAVAIKRIAAKDTDIERLQRQYDAGYGIIRKLEKENAELREAVGMLRDEGKDSRSVMSARIRDLEAKLAAAETDTKRLRYRLKHIEAAVNYQSEDQKRDDDARACPIPVEECGSILSPGDPSLCQFDPCKCLAIRGDAARGEKGE